MRQKVMLRPSIIWTMPERQHSKIPARWKTMTMSGFPGPDRQGRRV